MPQKRQHIPPYPYSNDFVRSVSSLIRDLQFKMKRNPRKLGWTKAFRAAHNKEMPLDATLQLAQRRAIPTRYNRELVAKTLEAMKRVEEIRSKRERRFYKKRMEGNRERQLEADRKLVRENQHLLPMSERDRVEGVLGEESGDEGMDEEMESMEGVEVSEVDRVLEKEEQARKAVASTIPEGKKSKVKTKMIVGERYD